MSARSKKATGQRLDNSRVFVKPGEGAVRNIGHPAVVSADAVRGVPGAGHIVVEGVPVAIAVVPAATSAGRKLQLQQMRAQMRANLLPAGDLEALWAPVLDAIERSWAGGAPPSPERATVFELLDAEVVAGRDPFDKKLAGAIGLRLMIRDASQIRRWRREWAKERGHN